MPRLTRSALGRPSGKTTASRPKTGRPGRQIRLTASMLQHARKRAVDAQKSGSPTTRPNGPDDRGPSPLAEEMMRKREEFERTGKITLSEDGKIATLTKLENGIRIRFIERKGAAPQTLTFTSSQEAGRWFEQNLPKHARV